MRYDQMQTTYPRIEDYFAQAADHIRSGMSVKAVLAFLDIRIRAEIGKAHQRAVTEKLARFAQLVQDNAGRTPAEMPHRAPEPCPHCGSLEVAGGVCGWCHNQVAV